MSFMVLAADNFSIITTYPQLTIWGKTRTTEIHKNDWFKSAAGPK